MVVRDYLLHIYYIPCRVEWDFYADWSQTTYISPVTSISIFATFSFQIFSTQFARICTTVCEVWLTRRIQFSLYYCRTRQTSIQSPHGPREANNLFINFSLQKLNLTDQHKHTLPNTYIHRVCIYFYISSIPMLL